MKPFFFLSVVVLVVALSAQARMGDSLAQTAARYGQPIATAGQPGELTSTRTFVASGLQVTCGYVNGRVEMETYSRDDRDFNGREVEALLRTNGTKQNKWTTPADGYVNGTYKRADGATATLTNNKLAIHSPKWADAVAKDQAAAKVAEDKAAQTAAENNTVNPNYDAGSGTNAASYVEPSASISTNSAAGSTRNSP